MGLLGKVGGYVGRGAAALASGGATEAYRGITGKKDPYTAYQERLGTAVGNKVAGATGVGGDGPGPDPYAETPEERRQRAQQEADMTTARGYAGDLRNAAGQVQPRQAPQVGAPGYISSARVNGATNVTADRINSTFDPAMADRARALQEGYISNLNQTMNGQGGPSAAEIALRRGGAAATSQAYALAGGHKGYGGAALRQAQRMGAAQMQQTTGAAAQMRSQEMAQARGEYGQAVQGLRAGDLAVGTTGANLALEAAKANQGTALDAERANQATQLQQNLTQAGFDQNAILHMSDQDLQVKLANAGMQLTQQQIDDLRQNNATQNAIAAQGQVLSGSNAEAQRQAQIKQLRAQYAMAVKANDQKQQDAILGTLAQLGAAYATGGGSVAAGAGGGLGHDGTIDPFAGG